MTWQVFAPRKLRKGHYLSRSSPRLASFRGESTLDTINSPKFIIVGFLPSVGADKRSLAMFEAWIAPTSLDGLKVGGVAKRSGLVAVRAQCFRFWHWVISVSDDNGLRFLGPNV